jgi:hypothetical protein
LALGVYFVSGLGTKAVSVSGIVVELRVALRGDIRGAGVGVLIAQDLGGFFGGPGGSTYSVPLQRLVCS